jgi:hypothetical protein
MLLGWILTGLLGLNRRSIARYRRYSGLVPWKRFGVDCLEVSMPRGVPNYRHDNDQADECRCDPDQQ